jgi:hypothetical protein
MLNNVKNEYNEVKAQLAIKADAEVQTDVSTEPLQDLKKETKETKEKSPIKLKIEETVSAVTNKVSDIVTRKKKEPISVSESTAIEEEKESKSITKKKEKYIEETKETEKTKETEEKTGEKKLPNAN